MARLITYQEVLEKRAADEVAASPDSNWVDHIVGGNAEGADPSQFDPEQLALGVQEEMEHTSDPDVAAEIAMDHLIKDPEYYQKLKLIEGDQESVEAAKVAGAVLAKLAAFGMPSLKPSTSLLPKVPKPPVGMLQKAPGVAQAGAKPLGALKVPWGKAMALGGLGAGLYGVAKAVPWLTRQLTEASSMPLAYGGGWSPIPYGYGYSPYGEGQPNLGVR